MAYSNKVIDHYENPRNVGSLPKDDPNVGTGLVGAPECGDVMKLQIKVNPTTGVIDDAKFKTFGCGSAIASSSLATEWLKGKTVDEALAIKNTDIVDELSLPPVKIHCSVLAEDAIKAAIADYKKKQATKARLPRRRRSRRRRRMRQADRGRGMIQITETAARKIRTLMAKQGIDEGGLRVGVKGGGCSGLSYTFAWEQAAAARRRGVRGARRREDLRRQEEPALPERHDARLRHEPDEQGLRVPQPEREDDLRLRQLVRRLMSARPVRCDMRQLSAESAVLPAVRSPAPAHGDYFSFSACRAATSTLASSSGASALSRSSIPTTSTTRRRPSGAPASSARRT